MRNELMKIDDNGRCLERPWSREPRDGREIELGGQVFQPLVAPSTSGSVTYRETDTGELITLFFSTLRSVSKRQVVFVTWAADLMIDSSPRFIFVASENVRGPISIDDWAVVGPVCAADFFRGAGAWKW